MLVNEMKHDDIADWCATRFKAMGYCFSCSNLTSATHGEQPDVLGINSSGKSILGEVKTTRSDYHKDKKKAWRIDSDKGMGDLRVYITPKGLLKPEEIPFGWMLWEVHGKTKPFLKVIKGMVDRKVETRWGHSMKTVYLHCDHEEYSYYDEQCNGKRYQKELTWMIKIMKRAIEKGFEPNDFANNYQNKVLT